MAEELVKVEGLRKTFQHGKAETIAIDELNFTLHEGEFLVIVGPSGCGKTTLLRCISGLAEPTSGCVWHNGVRVTRVPPTLQLVFQEYNRSLFPWLTVERNVRFALRGLPRDVAAARVRQALELVALGDSDTAKKYPWQLSGGMQQRVAIARAIAAQPELLLMDEPFASVDAQTRMSLEMMLLDLWRELNLSVLFVTHDIDEAIFLADRVLVLSQRPSTMIAELAVDLPRPRDQLKTKELPRFLDLRKEVYGLVGLRSDKAEAAQTASGSR